MKLKVKRARVDGVITTCTVRACPDYLDPETQDRKPAVRGELELALRQFTAAGGRVRHVYRTRKLKHATFRQDAATEARALLRSFTASEQDGHEPGRARRLYRELRLIARRYRLTLDELERLAQFQGTVNH